LENKLLPFKVQSSNKNKAGRREGKRTLANQQPAG